MDGPSSKAIDHHPVTFHITSLDTLCEWSKRRWCNRWRGTSLNLSLGKPAITCSLILRLSLWDVTYSRNSHPKQFCKKNVLRNFAKFLGIQNSCEFCGISKNTFSYRTSPVAASDIWVWLTWPMSNHRLPRNLCTLSHSRSFLSHYELCCNDTTAQLNQWPWFSLEISL